MNNNQLISNYYSEHRDEIINFIAVRIMDATEAEDMVQDIFLRLLRGHHLMTTDTVPALVYTMARHAIADFHRHRHVHEAYEHHLKKSDVGSLISDIDVESIYCATQIMERMERSLARLPKACCEIYRLHIYDSLKVSEIARELSLPYKQVENRLGQARKAVRQQLRCCV